MGRKRARTKIARQHFYLVLVDMELLQPGYRRGRGCHGADHMGFRQVRLGNWQIDAGSVRRPLKLGSATARVNAKQGGNFVVPSSKRKRGTAMAW